MSEDHTNLIFQKQANIGTFFWATVNAYLAHFHRSGGILPCAKFKFDLTWKDRAIDVLTHLETLKVEKATNICVSPFSCCSPLASHSVHISHLQYIMFSTQLVEQTICSGEHIIANEKNCYYDTSLLTLDIYLPQC